MIIIIGNILLLGLIRFILPAKSKSKNIFVFLAGFTLFLIASFRSINFGSDTIGYVSRYISLTYVSLSELWTNVLSQTGKDPFFYLFAKLISLTGANYQIWLAVMAGIFCLSISKLINNYSNEAYMSYVALISLGYFYFSLTGLRQTMALAMIVLSYKYLIDRKLLPFVVLVLIGSLFHSSALIFLIAYPLAYMNVGWKQISGIAISLILSYFYKDIIILLLKYFNMADKYEYYLTHGTSLTISGFVIQLAIYLFCLFYKKDVLKSDLSNLSLYNLLFLGLVLQSFSAVIAEFFRISMYFSLFGIILIPKSIATIKDKNLKAITYFFILLVLLGYIFWTGSFNEFRLFWQEGL